jgi:choline-sulfatase
VARSRTLSSRGRPLRPGTLFLALIALSLLAGAAAGLLDALWAALRSPATRPSFVFFLLAASLGATLALGGALPFTLLMTIARRPRSTAGRLAGLVAVLVAIPPALFVGRSLYKRIPWGPGDFAFGAAALAGLAVLLIVVGAVARGLLARRADRHARRLAQASLPALLLVLPLAFRLGVPAAPPDRTAPTASGPRPSNILLLTIDTIRADRFGAMGDPGARTPWFDRISRSSRLYADCLAPSPWTLPSLASLLTGSYPGQHRMLAELAGIDASVPALAEVCARHGMTTAAFVANPWLAAGDLERGFDTFDVAERFERIRETSTTFAYRFLMKGLLRALRLDSARRISSQGIHWIEGAREPWFLWLHYLDPHLPNWPEPPFDRLFGPPPELIGSSLTAQQIRDGDFPGGARGRQEIDRLYRGEITFTDREIGRVWRFVQEADLLKRTVVVFTGDHGEELWDHNDYGHGHAMYNEVVRVPLLVRLPGARSGEVVRELARLVDLAPTALAAAGLDLPEKPAFTGEDFLASRGADTPQHPNIAYGEAVLYGQEQKFLRVNRWKLILGEPDAEGERPKHLFDVQSDPGERDDVATQRAALTDSLQAQLLEWMARYGSEGAMAARDLPDNLDPAIREQLEALGYIQ